MSRRGDTYVLAGLLAAPGLVSPSFHHRFTRVINASCWTSIVGHELLCSVSPCLFAPFWTTSDCPPCRGWYRPSSRNMLTKLREYRDKEMAMEVTWYVKTVVCVCLFYVMVWLLYLPVHGVALSPRCPTDVLTEIFVFSWSFTVHGICPLSCVTWARDKAWNICRFEGCNVEYCKAWALLSISVLEVLGLWFSSIFIFASLFLFFSFFLFAVRFLLWQACTKRCTVVYQ